MPREESQYPQDWFSKARQDMRTVDILLREGGDAECFLSNLGFYQVLA